MLEVALVAEEVLVVWFLMTCVIFAGGFLSQLVTMLMSNLNLEWKDVRNYRHQQDQHEAALEKQRAAYEQSDEYKQKMQREMEKWQKYEQNKRQEDERKEEERRKQWEEKQRRDEALQRQWQKAMDEDQKNQREWWRNEQNQQQYGYQDQQPSQIIQSIF